MAPWWVYLVRCRDGSLYTGATTDPAARLAAHNAGRGGAYTRSRRPVALAYCEPAPDRATALRREWALKQLSRSAKETLVATARPSPAGFAGFPPAALGFLRRLKRHNTREWFTEHKPLYHQALQQPLRALMEELDVRLATLAPEMRADPERSLFRIHRDVRFARDKSPYKTNAGAWCYHRDGGRTFSPDGSRGGAGFYLHLEPGHCFVAAGIWMPPRPMLNRLREAIADDAAGFGAILTAPAFQRRYGSLDETAMLQRLPRGYAPGHPAERWLRYQSFTVSRPLTDRQIESRRLIATLETDFDRLLPLVRWLNAALGLPPADRRL